MFFLRRCIGAVFFFGAPVFLTVVASAAVCLQSIFGPIDPPNVDRDRLVQLMKFRDFRTLSSPVIAGLAERNDVEFGRRSGKMPEFRFSSTEKKIYAYFGAKRQTNGSCFETNLRLMARAKYFDWMNRFETLSSPEQSALMNEIIDDMKWWEELYMNFLRAAELPIPSLAELMREFDEMIESFKIGAEAADIARIDRFKQRMSAGFVAREIKNTVNGIPGISVLGSVLLLSPKKTNEAGEKATKTVP